MCNVDLQQIYKSSMSFKLTHGSLFDVEIFNFKS